MQGHNNFALSTSYNTSKSNHVRSKVLHNVSDNITDGMEQLAFVSGVTVSGIAVHSHPTPYQTKSHNRDAQVVNKENFYVDNS
ncbi:hypothetical protein SNOG_01637 [Parastagonospora nodorum SN15]|uniref:Uncharacterized protein n=1 Tax=Phaeosphaeria nodorum (strain SN15 / ATCC MYA-4574 / FGSC 10173) TaxID=321614 RepID=Q0V2X7_PHANO|nr:hypothetical protein SNOG_01637 [Parastagonospora nodorum SN15]EAT91286.1 hypothetical protein SNOG_01637 [Parastagonospora nodorum SN15]